MYVLIIRNLLCVMLIMLISLYVIVRLSVVSSSMLLSDRLVNIVLMILLWCCSVCNVLSLCCVVLCMCVLGFV